MTRLAFLQCNVEQLEADLFHERYALADEAIRRSRLESIMRPASAPLRISLWDYLRPQDLVLLQTHNAIWGFDTMIYSSSALRDAVAIFSGRLRLLQHSA